MEIVYPENISAALKVQFDREALPLPLRPVAYLTHNGIYRVIGCNGPFKSKNPD